MAAALLWAAAAQAVWQRHDKAWNRSLTPGREDQVTFYQAATFELSYRVNTNTLPVDLSNTNYLPVWEVTGQGDAYTNVYLSITGAVVSATNGWIEFDLTPEESNLPASNYNGYVRIVELVDGTNLVNQGVIVEQKVTVKWSPDNRYYATVEPLTYPAGLTGAYHAGNSGTGAVARVGDQIAITMPDTAAGSGDITAVTAGDGLGGGGESGAVTVRLDVASAVWSQGVHSAEADELGLAAVEALSDSVSNTFVRRAGDSLSGVIDMAGFAVTNVGVLYFDGGGAGVSPGITHSTAAGAGVALTLGGNRLGDIADPLLSEPGKYVGDVAWNDARYSNLTYSPLTPRLNIGEVGGQLNITHDWQYLSCIVTGNVTGVTFRAASLYSILATNAGAHSWTFDTNVFSWGTGGTPTLATNGWDEILFRTANGRTHGRQAGGHDD